MLTITCASTFTQQRHANTNTSSICAENIRYQFEERIDSNWERKQNTAGASKSTLAQCATFHSSQVIRFDQRLLLVLLQRCAGLHQELVSV